MCGSAAWGISLMTRNNMTESTKATNPTNLPGDAITPEALRANPNLVATTVTFDGAPVLFRPVSSRDAVILGDYFLGLSMETKRRYGPHAFDRATAEELCATTDPAKTLRMIATVPGDAGEQIIAYLILILGTRDDDVA